MQIPMLKIYAGGTKLKPITFKKDFYYCYFNSILKFSFDVVSNVFFLYLHSQGFVTLDSCEAAEKAVDEVCRGEKSTLLLLVTLTLSIPRTH